MNSGEFNGLPWEEANRTMTADAKARGIGEGTVQYRLKDWGISRQRYWGTPIPIVHCEKDGVVPVPYDRAAGRSCRRSPTFTGRGDSPLAQVPEFVNVTCPTCGGPARRETDTMDTFVDSSWYFLRFCRSEERPSCRSIRRPRPTGCRSISTAAASSTRSCTCSTRASSRACCATSAWSTFDEPFKRLLTQGMVLKNGAVMSKSKGNVVDPDDMLQKYGADALRLYVMFVAPPEKEVEWSDAGLEGSFRFLMRVWRLVDHWAETIGGEGIPACGDDCTDAERALRRKTHDTIRRVTGDIEERMHLNTAVSSLMELVNELYAFSEGTAHGAPSRAEPPARPRRAAADDCRAARSDRRAGR